MVKLTQIFFVGTVRFTKTLTTTARWITGNSFSVWRREGVYFFFGLVYFSRSLFMLHCDFSAITAFQSLGYTCYSSLRTFSTWWWHDVGEFSTEKGPDTCVRESVLAVFLPALGSWQRPQSVLAILCGWPDRSRGGDCANKRTWFNLQYLRHAV